MHYLCLSLPVVAPSLQTFSCSYFLHHHPSLSLICYILWDWDRFVGFYACYCLLYCMCPAFSLYCTGHGFAVATPSIPLPHLLCLHIPSLPLLVHTICSPLCPTLFYLYTLWLWLGKQTTCPSTCLHEKAWTTVAQAPFPFLSCALAVWDGKQARHSPLSLLA